MVRVRVDGFAKGAVAGGVELGEFVVDVDGDGADQPDGLGLGRGHVHQERVVDQPALETQLLDGQAEVFGHPGGDRVRGEG